MSATSALSSDEDGDDSESMIASSIRDFGKGVAEVCKFYNPLLRPLGVRLQYQTEFWNSHQVMPKDCHLPIKGWVTIALYNQSSSQQVVSCTGYYLSGQYTKSASVPVFDLEMICSDGRQRGYTQICVLAMMMVVVKLQNKPQYRVDQIVAYCLNLGGQPLPPIDTDLLEPRGEGLHKLTWTKSYNMLLSLGFIGIKIASSHLLKKDLKGQVEKRLGRPLQHCEGSCQMWDRPDILQQIFEAKPIGHLTGNYKLVCEWALQEYTTQRVGNCCRLQDLLLKAHRQEQDFNIFYPLWVPEQTDREAYLYDLQDRLDRQIRDKITYVLEHQVYQRV